MEPSRLVDELVRTATKVGIVVRMEPFKTSPENERPLRGGLCILRGKRIIFVDANASVRDQVATLAKALSSVDLEGVFLPPIVRATIEAHIQPSNSS